MMRRIHILVAFLLLTLLPAAAQNINFSHLSTKEDLSHYSVMSIYQDSKGLIWIGTRNGVNVYDGNEITVFKHSCANAGSIASNSVRQITGDGKECIYFLTLRGVSVFDTRSEQFKTLTHNNVSAMHFKERLYIALENSIYAYDGNRFSAVFSLPSHDAQITSLLVDGAAILIGTREHGCLSYDMESRTLTKILENDGEVCKIFKDSQKRYWIGTLNNGLYRMDGAEMRHYRAEAGNPSTLCSNYVRDMCEDMEGGIWIGTFRGLNKYCPETDDFLSYPNTSRDNLSVSSVWSLLCDVQGNIWIGTYFGGVDYFNPTQSIFHHYKVAMAEGEGLSAPIVGTMTEDDRHNIWICTEGGGLNMFNPQTRLFTWHRNAHGSGLSQNNVKTAYFDGGRNCLWAGTHLGGLNRLDLATGRITHYQYQKQLSHKSNIICDIVPYKNQLLLATHNGVYQFNPDTALFTPLFREGKEGEIISFALDLCIDSRGILWIGGAEKGAYAYDFVTERLKLYNNRPDNPHSLSSNGINCIYEDSLHRLWFGTAESGLDLYHPDTDGFTHYDEAGARLLSNCVYGVCSAAADKVYIITDRGLSTLNPQTGRVDNYAVNKSMPLSAINQNALFMASDGRLYIGGVDGLLAFNPKDLEQRTRPYQIFPFKLFINDEQVKIGDSNGILQEVLAQTGHLTFATPQPMISFQYAVTNYSPFNADDILYRLENFSAEWSTLRSSRMITYTNLAPGKYRLVVKAVNRDGQEKVMSSLDITILPPWYRAWWAYLIYAVTALGILAYLVRTYYRRLKLQTELKYERNYIKDIEELNQSKLRFFTNISHEFRTPLTIIIGQMEMLLQVKNIAPMVYNKILRTYKSCLQLQELINELLDFRKQEQGKMKVRVGEHNIVEFLHENYLLFQEYANTRKINFKFNKSNDCIMVWYDTKQLQKVINNLLSNAFKYTPEGGEIALSVARRGSEVVVDVADTGKGIPADEQENIFQRFYQTQTGSSSMSAGSGIGLALAKGIVELHHGTIKVISAPGEGSTFSFQIPLGNSHYTSDEICRNEKADYITPPPSEERTIEVEEMAEQSQVIMDAGDEKRFKIVIAEDEASLREMLAELFEPYYKVTAVTNGKEALAAIEEEAPDLVLSDVLMDEMTGIELCRHLKSHIETCHIPVVLLTARTAVEHKLEGIQMGADDYITKPFEINILLARCKNLVNNRLMLQEKFSKLPQANTQLIATNPLDKKFVDQAMQVIERNLDNADFSMNDFAQEMCVARTKLFQKLKAITGQTPNDFILTVRLRKGALLLKNNPEYNIADISTMLGFSSPRYFSRCFKDKYGAPPQAYRKTDDSGTAVEDLEGMSDEDQ